MTDIVENRLFSPDDLPGQPGRFVADSAPNNRADYDGELSDASDEPFRPELTSLEEIIGRNEVLPQDRDALTMLALSRQLGTPATQETTEISRGFPRTEKGLFDLDEIAPGDFHGVWGPVKGTYTGKIDIDIAIAPSKVPKKQVRLAAAREFAKLENSITLAEKSDKQDRVASLSQQRDKHLRWSLEKGYRNETEWDVANRTNAQLRKQRTF